VTVWFCLNLNGVAGFPISADLNDIEACMAHLMSRLIGVIGLVAGERNCPVLGRCEYEFSLSVGHVEF